MKKVILGACSLFLFLSAMECKDPSPVAVEKVTISAPATTPATLTPGSTLQLSVNIQPSNAANKKVTWSSSDKTRATVDATGKVTIPKEATAGPVTISVVTNDGAKKADWNLTVATSAATTYSATISPTSKTFTGATTGYGTQAAQQFTLTNTGTGTINTVAAILNAGTGSPFEISTALSATTVAAGKTLTVSVRPKTGLAAKAYTDQLKITGSNGISLTVSLNFTVSAAATYIASVDLASKTFTAANTGYGTQPAQVFTIKNDGTGTINTLAAALKTGTAFEISAALSGTTVAATKTQTVSVRPKTGLGAGTYTDQLNITGSNGISLSVSLNFTVTTASIPVYSATITPDTKTFTGATVGYGAQTAQVFTIANTGTGNITSLAAALKTGTNFEISAALSGTSAASGGSQTVSVRPKTGLAAGTYTDQLNITGSNGISLSATLNFTVAAAASPLAFTGTFSIPASTVGTAITNINVSTGASGGKTPYTFSATGLPAGITINASTGVISGTPTTEAPAGTANITVKDASTPQQSKGITITCGAISAAAPVDYFTGAGTPENPYQIGTAADLAKLAELVNAHTAPYFASGKFYKLTANINLGVNPYNKGAGWTPIGKDFDNAFQGTFDGNGKSVSGLFINNSTLNYVGLFGYNRGVIKNLGVAGVNINHSTTGTGEYYTGGVAGYSLISVINCYVSGTITGKRVGGVVGFNQGDVTNCYSAANVSGTQNVGGVVAENQSGGLLVGSVANCYVTGSVTSNNTAGGVVGRNVNNDALISKIQNCVALNPSVKASTAGRIVGNFISGDLSGNSAYSGMTNISGATFPSGGLTDENGLNLTAADAQLQATYLTGKGWKFGTNETNPWKWGGTAYPLPVLWYQTTSTYPTFPSHL